MNEIDNNVMLTTSDNPYSPFSDYDRWLAFDESKNYYTNEYLGRIVISSSELSSVDEEEAILNAIDEIVELNVLGLYKKVRESDYKDGKLIDVAS